MSLDLQLICILTKPSWLMNSITKGQWQMDEADKIIYFAPLVISLIVIQNVSD